MVEMVTFSMAEVATHKRVKPTKSTTISLQSVQMCVLTFGFTAL